MVILDPFPFLVQVHFSLSGLALLHHPKLKAVPNALAPLFPIFSHLAKAPFNWWALAQLGGPITAFNFPKFSTHVPKRYLLSLAWKPEMVGINDCGERKLSCTFFKGGRGSPAPILEGNIPSFALLVLGHMLWWDFSLLCISDIYFVPPPLNALLCSNLCVGSESWMEFQPQIASNWVWNQTETQTQFRWVLIPWIYHCAKARFSSYPDECLHMSIGSKM